ncbi:hypothetical protein FCM35_KLT18990 [Carex littledalei]|uniref:Uncharacterized protein n=1 Tax=Carex littledalei TaxID=544730 RepID=A0A833VX91_9POAL|nr:hypothetical protein FCM35_KLT18990 [Carex littledalei]
MGGGVLRTAIKAAGNLGTYHPALGRTTSAVGLKSTVPAPPPSVSSAVADSAPRLVFSPVPTLEEALEATSDLTCALERANEHGQMGIFQNNAIRPARPRGVAQAFSLLQTSTEAQSVVASLVSDKNVWDAVLKNEKLNEFFRNHQSNDPLGESLNTNQNKSEKVHSEAGEAPHGSNGFSKFVNNVKVKAMEVVNNISNLIQDNKVKAMEFVNNISNLIQDFFETKDRADSSEAGSTYQSFTSPNTFYVLAIAVIAIVLLKRA